MGVLYARVAGAWVPISMGAVGPTGPPGPSGPIGNSCYVATTANIALTGSPTIDGVAVPAGMRVLVKDQTTASQNGIYISAAGAWARAPEMDAGTEVVGTTVYVQAGRVNDKSMWAVWSPTANVTPVIGTTAIIWTRVGVQGPAYAGEWRSDPATPNSDQNVAQFGNLAVFGKEGMHVTNDGFVRFYSAPMTPWSGPNQFQFIQVAADHTSETWVASIAPNQVQVADIAIGSHPPTGWMGLFKPSEGANYLCVRGPGGEALLNAGNAVISLRQNNIAKFDVGSDYMTGSGHFTSIGTFPGNDWTTAHFLGYPQQSGSDQARVALHSPGVAPQIRCVATNGEQIGIVNSNSQAWARLGAASFEVNSSITAKRDVRELDARPLRMERERIVVHHSVDADLVPDVDIMALRPVAFRPKLGAQKLVPPEGMEYSECQPTDLLTVPMDGILGHEGSRERLGLIAEEVETIVPSAVTHDCYGEALGIDYAQITVALLDHVQRLTDEVATLRYRVAELEGIT